MSHHDIQRSYADIGIRSGVMGFRGGAVAQQINTEGRATSVGDEVHPSVVLPGGRSGAAQAMDQRDRPILWSGSAGG